MSLVPFPRSISYRSNLRGPNRAGFTIVELLVASAITLVVIGLMLQVTFSVLKTFDNVNGSISARSQAAVVLKYLREDLQSIVWRRDDNVWLLATIQRDQNGINSGRGDTNHSDAAWMPTTASGFTPVPKPGLANAGADGSSLRLDLPGATAGRFLDLQDYRFGQAGVWLRFFTNRQTGSSEGDVAPIAVAYQIVRMKPRPDSEEFRYMFFRSQVRSGRETVANDYSVADAGYDLTGDLNKGYNRPGTPGANNNIAFGDPGSVRRPNRDALLANNVIDFGVRFWKKIPPSPTQPEDTPSTLRLIFPADANGRPLESNLAFAVTNKTPAQLVAGTGIPFGPTNPAEISSGYPDFADVFVRVLSDEGARRIEAIEQGRAPVPPQYTDQEYWWLVAEQHSEVYTERVPLTARPF